MVSLSIVVALLLLALIVLPVLINYIRHTRQSVRYRFKYERVQSPTGLDEAAAFERGYYRIYIEIGKSAKIQTKLMGKWVDMDQSSEAVRRACRSMYERLTLDDQKDNTELKAILEPFC